MSAGALPLWRQWLRGLSQCAFQSNEVTGVLFALAVAIHSVRMAGLYLLGAAVGTLVARLARANDALLDLGLFGFNAALMGLALGNFFVAGTAVWLWAPLLGAVATLVALAMSRWLPWPFLAAPFILTLWVVWPFAGDIGLTKVDFDAFAAAPVQWAAAVLAAPGSALFSPGLASGALFLVGVALANWRHALVAAIGALVAGAIAVQAGASGGAINAGFVGFNGVLAALAAFALIAPDLRLAVLGSLLATWLGSYLTRGAPVPVLASGFVMSVWLMLALGWLNPRLLNKRLQVPDVVERVD